MKQKQLISIMAGEDRSSAAAMVRAGFAAMEPFYRLGLGVRNVMFDLGLRGARRLPRPVISVGNITTGGTGKTPMVIELAKRLRAIKAKPAVLIRGYKQTLHGSEEALLLAQALGEDVPVEVGADRAAAAMRVLARRPDVNMFLLDDGFQHRQIARDVNLVLIDALRPSGFGHVLPRGLLREPLRNLRRADAVIVTRADQVAPAALAAIDRMVEENSGRPPIAHAVHEWTGFRDQSEQVHPLDALRHAKVVALSAIGNPAAFEASLRARVDTIVEHCVFDDHEDAAAFGPALKLASDRGAAAIVTTEKDWVKWRPAFQNATPAIPIYRPVLEIRFLDGGEKVDAMLRPLAKANP